ncbi:ABC transporter substrate-binding protein [Solwaraspora sp. WMMD406]|uniref:ABC transporter substrate-binding protein n=1 Tax=Solwaraspora sp. WMMD406 TaxID=3016095 RepID=UPI002417238C|nr:ABC transporter substrate-binding protein [Solwaraspora sp. WMMD406]MDG4765464.1 ABC transporter substrate-binding protein [Solwaraspora sp. WMMD406]
MTITHSRIRRTVVGAIGAFAVLLAATGCGEQDSTEQPGGAAPSASADADLAALVPDEIKADGKILVGTDASYAPAEFLDTDGATVIGFDVDLFNAVAGKLGLTTEYVPSQFDDIIPGVMSGKYEIGVSSFTINDERKAQVNMVSYFAAGTQWAAPAGAPVDPDDACGKRVAVQAGTVQVEDIEARSAACTAAGNPEITIEQFQGQDQATASVVSGKNDAMLADSPVCAYAVQQTNGELELAGDIYDSAPYGYVVAQEQTAFADALAEALTAVIADGSYEQALSNWGVEAGGITDPAVNP